MSGVVEKQLRTHGAVVAREDTYEALLPNPVHAASAPPPAKTFVFYLKEIKRVAAVCRQVTGGGGPSHVCQHVLTGVRPTRVISTTAR